MSHKVLYKVGGSLLDIPDLFEQLQQILNKREDERALLLFGGGQAADLVREWQEKFSLSDEQSHELAIRAMDFNAGLAFQKFTDPAWVTAAKELDDAWEFDFTAILNTELFLAEYKEIEKKELPHTWECTSDAIAAWCAIKLGFDEIRFMKSVSAPNDDDLFDAGSDILDKVVRKFLPQIPVISWCNLRESQEIVTISRS